MMNDCHPNPDNALARMESYSDFLLVLFRAMLSFSYRFLENEAGAWILVCMMLILSLALCYNYFRCLPYFEQEISIFWGILCCVLFWFSLNALLIQMITVYGHITIIFIAIPIIAGTVRNLWVKRVNSLIIESVARLKMEHEVLNQIYIFDRMVKEFLITGKQTVELTGLVNVLILECEDQDCLCRHSGELYDIKSGLFSFEIPKTVLFKNHIFLKFLVGKLFRHALSRFPNSPQIHIAYAHYIFASIHNIHLAIIQLSNATKKKPNFQQEFSIFRATTAIQDYLKFECLKGKDIYHNLTSVIEIGSVAEQCQKSIEKLCGIQMEFWTQLYWKSPLVFEGSWCVHNGP
eukprot:TRINITY_DN5655_c0_g6_i1.p1 TRINITY_DN5655_c0_g6~~TRINITY_DN5655_c0_g6_i1.p1  ORF type:complete len:348 (+),score=25.59 TRINITY_DN5655_c0_g6_i1:640-1683(+)